MDVADIRERFDAEVRARPPAQIGRETRWVDRERRKIAASIRDLGPDMQ